MSHDGQIGGPVNPPQRPALVYAYLTSAIRLMSSRRKLVSVAASNNFVAKRDELNLSNALPIGGDQITDRQLLITPDERFCFSDAPGHGSGQVQCIRLKDNLYTQNNISSPFDVSLTLRRGYRGFVKANPRQSAAFPNLYYCWWGLSWPSLTDPGDNRNKGLLTFFGTDVATIGAFPTLPGTAFGNNDVILAFDNNFIWTLSHDSNTDKYYTSRIDNNFNQTVPQQIGAFTQAVTVPSSQPMQQTCSSAHQKLAFVMRDGTIQIWNYDNNGQISFNQRLTIANLRWMDTAFCFERLQPNGNFKGSFFAIRTTQAGASRSLLRISWNDFSILEEIDFSQFVYQDASHFPAPPGSVDTTQMNDIAIDPLSGEFYFAFSNTVGGNERKHQIKSRIFWQMNFY